jgi:hypothetical protein
VAQSIWNDARVAEAKRLYEAGRSASETAAELSRDSGIAITRNAVIGMWHRKGIGGRSAPLKSGPKPKAEPRRIVRIRQTAAGHLHFIETVEKDQPALRAAQVEPLHISLLDLKHNSCRFPYGLGPYTFCGCEAVPDRPYCAPHQELCGGELISTHEARSRAQKRRWAHLRLVRAEVAAA